MPDTHRKHRLHYQRSSHCLRCTQFPSALPSQHLTERYGAPIVVFNLLKTQERYQREMVLGREYEYAVNVLNANPPGGTAIHYISWDFKKHTKVRGSDVLNRIRRNVEAALQLTDLFVFLPKKPRFLASSPLTPLVLKMQHGVTRTNCIDCMDRTNFAQYALGLVAIGHQLHELNLTPSPAIERDSTLAEALMELYIEMGDAVAQQYSGTEAHKSVFNRQRGASELHLQRDRLLLNLQRFATNHRARDVRQWTLNLMLGVFIPQPQGPHIWDLDDDDYLHNAPPTFYQEHPDYLSPDRSNAHGSDRKETFTWLPEHLSVHPTSRRRYRSDSLPRQGSVQGRSQTMAEEAYGGSRLVLDSRDSSQSIKDFRRSSASGSPTLCDGSCSSSCGTLQQ